MSGAATDHATDHATGHPTGEPTGRAPWPEWTLVAACAVLLVAASLPLERVFIGWGFARYVGATIALSLGGQVLARRAGAGPLVGLGVSAAAWAVFISLAFLPETLMAGLVPTSETLAAGADLFRHGVELIQNRPAPTFAEPGLVVLAVTGVWWIAHAVHVLAVRLRSPLHAVAAALVMWTIPLAIAPAPAAQAWRQAVPILAAAVVVLLLGSERTMGRADGRMQAGSRGPLPPATGWVTGAGAIVAGVALVGLVPGFDSEPLIQPGQGGGLTRTDNPIVDIRANLVNQSEQPVAEVRTADPVYLRLTSLDVYSAKEQWTNDGLNGRKISGRLPPEAGAQPVSRFVDVEIEAYGVHSALVPAPYQATEVSGARAEDLRWDPDMATLTMATGRTLDTGDTYQVTTAVPDPPADALRDVDVSRADPKLTELPSLPDEVADLAERIVAERDADNAFDQAMAIQEELRSWEYSLEPERGHGQSHMVAFVERRVGYCEQFAGTMAAMLRSLDIPARVAVGYTPGDPVGQDSYIVRGRNAHAWVEVLFPGYGWITFEPTPRDDLNLLTPSDDRLAPTELDSDRVARDDTTPDIESPDDDALDPGEMDDLADEELDSADEPAAAGDAGGDGSGARPWWWVGALVAGLAGAGALLARRHAVQPPMVPAEATLARLARLERLGAGLGHVRRAHETDAEYIRAIARHADHAEPLVAAVDRARWAPSVPRHDALAARESEQAIRRDRVDGLSAVARARVAVRGVTHLARRRATRHLASLDSALRGLRR